MILPLAIASALLAVVEDDEEEDLGEMLARYIVFKRVNKLFEEHPNLKYLKDEEVRVVAEWILFEVAPKLNDKLATQIFNAILLVSMNAKRGNLGFDFQGPDEFPFSSPSMTIRAPLEAVTGDSKETFLATFFRYFVQNQLEIEVLDEDGDEINPRALISSSTPSGIPFHFEIYWFDVRDIPRPEREKGDVRVNIVLPDVVQSLKSWLDHQDKDTQKSFYMDELSDSDETDRWIREKNEVRRSSNRFTHLIDLRKVLCFGEETTVETKTDARAMNGEVVTADDLFTELPQLAIEYGKKVDDLMSELFEYVWKRHKSSYEKPYVEKP
jgi:hypothetical protein